MNTFIDFLRPRPDAYGGRQSAKAPASPDGTSPAERAIGGPGKDVTMAVMPGECGIGEPGKDVTMAVMPGECGIGDPADITTQALGETGRGANQAPFSSLSKALDSVAPGRRTGPTQGGRGGDAGRGGSQNSGPTPSGNTSETSGTEPPPNKHSTGGSAPRPLPQGS